MNNPDNQPASGHLATGHLVAPTTDHRPPTTRILGLTGGIASGKSTVARLLAARGAVVIDSDVLVHELYAAPEFAVRVQELFGTPILRNGVVDRRALGALVFNDADALGRLEALVHPAVAALRSEKLRVAAALVPPAVVLEAVKLIEAGHAEKCEAVWCVVCDEIVQTQRLMEKRGLTADEARARLKNQPPLQEKITLLRRAVNDVPFVVIENNGTLEELERRVEQEWQTFLQTA